MNRMRISVPGIDPALYNYDNAKEMLFVKLCCPENNQEFLKSVPHTMVGDMAATYHLIMPGNRDELASVVVDYELFGRLNIGKEQMHMDALENTPKVLPPMINSMASIFMGGANVPGEPGENWKSAFQDQLDGMRFDNMAMVVLSNSRMMNGAALMCNQELMAMVGDQFKENFFVLPSSVHEVIIVPDNGTLKARDLEEMVRTVNEMEVAPPDKLSDSLYHYDAKDHLLERADVFAQRMKEKALEVSKDRPMTAKNVTIERESIKVRLESAAKESAAQPIKKAAQKEQLLS